jgi:carboxyl-terminal processing protease
MFRLSDGSELRLTISRYYTPSGRSIQRHYEKGFSEYENDFHSRVEKGELFHSDSIHFNDSLKFHTGKGRIVYAGGGIMPDHFIPLDTTEDSNYYIQLLNTNILREYALEYYQKNQKKLEKMDFEQYRKDFQVDEKMIDDITGMAIKAGVPFDEVGYKKSEKVIKAIVKATIARSVWGRESFYPIINEVNEIFQESLKLFGEAEALAAM